MDPRHLIRIQRQLPAQGPQTAGSPARNLIRQLALDLHRAGVPAPELEDTVAALGSSVGQAAVALASPTSLFLSFPDGPRPDLHLERVEPGATDLGRLVELEALARSVADGSLSAPEGLECLEQQRSQRPLWGSVQQAGAFALAALAASIFFGSPLVDAAAAALLGLGVGCACIWSRQRPGWARLLEPLAAMATTLGALALARQGWISTPESVALAALIVLVPGYDLTVALFEMAQRHLTSGTTRLFGALGSFLGLGLGLGLGRLVGSELLGAGTPFPPLAQPAWAILPALLATPLAFGVLLQLHPGHLGWATLGGLVAFFGARLGSGALGPEFGAGAGAFLLGAVANLVARWARLPAAVTLVPGILLLVPGSVGFHSVAQFLQHDPVAGIEAAFRMALVGTALVGGLLAAHALVPPRAPAPYPEEGPKEGPTEGPKEGSPSARIPANRHTAENEVVTPQGLEP